MKLATLTGIIMHHGMTYGFANHFGKTYMSNYVSNSARKSRGVLNIPALLASYTFINNTLILRFHQTDIYPISNMHLQILSVNAMELYGQVP